MKRNILAAVAIVALAATVSVDLALAGGRLGLGRRTTTSTSGWHGDYYNTTWGAPVAVVVPPTARRYVAWGIGVGDTRITRVETQFQPGYPTPSTPGQRLLPAPAWPENTNQFGTHYIRGPW
jgi:hypothetical protein